ncbi:MAG: hypothetical protein ACOX7Q_08610, partial [Kiritimatiellia bacterium]
MKTVNPQNSRISFVGGVHDALCDENAERPTSNTERRSGEHETPNVRIAERWEGESNAEPLRLRTPVRKTEQCLKLGTSKPEIPRPPLFAI